MSRFDQLWRQWGRALHRVKVDVALDLGSHTTRVMINGKLCFAEPSCVVVHRTNGTVIEIGQRAWTVWHKTPMQFATSFVIHQGLVRSPELLHGYLEAVVKRLAADGVLPSWRLVDTTVSIPHTASPVDQKIFSQVCKATLGGWVKLVPKANAMAALRTDAVVFNGGVLDIGHDTTEVVIIANGKPIFSKTLLWGGSHVTQALQEQIAAHHQVHLSWQVAEQLKYKLAQVKLGDKRGSGKQGRQLTVRGKHMLSASPISIQVSAEECQTAVETPVTALFTELQHLFQLLPAETTAYVSQEGWLLVGGGSKLNGLAECLAEKLQAQCTLAAQPELMLVKGLSRVAVHS